jgi:hypothetical protein
MASISSSTIESLADLDDICLPIENLTDRFVFIEDSNYVALLGEIDTGGNSAKVKGDRVGPVELEVLNVFGEEEKNLVLGLVVSFLT